MERKWLLLVSFTILAVGLAGCGVPDEQESDENEASEQGNVGEGEIPGVGAIGLVGAVAAAAGLALWSRRRG
jgi:hypothetical protein